MTARPPLVDVVTPPERAARYRADGLWTDDTLASMVNRHADRAPDSVAVIDELGAGTHTYRTLRRDAARLAGRLARLGLAAGDVVSVQLPNRYRTVVTAVAVQSLGAVINPLLPNYRAREIAHVLATARSRVLITPGTYRNFDYLPMVDEIRQRGGVDPLHVVDDESAPADRSLPALIDGSGAPALPEVPSPVSELIFTSGTEATPKAIMHTEANTNCAVRTLFADLGADHDRVVWMPSPVGHSTGFNYGIRAALYHGRPLVLQDRWDAAEAVDLLLARGGTYTLAATTFLADLVRECESRGIRLPQLREFGCGGAPVPPDLVRRADALGIQVLRLYGSTEVLCATWNRPGDTLERRANTDGLALSRTEVDIRDDDGRSVPPGTPGELHVRSAQASVGFFADPERTAATYLPGGWVRSGDLASLDAEGYLTIVGRKKEIIIRGGVNIAPREIEEMIAAFPEVDRVAVIGLPDDRLGERTCACVVLHPGRSIDLAEIVARLRATGLAVYKLPERLHVMPELPTTPSGKVQKHVITQQIQRHERQAADAEGER
ncbi:MAG TPA: AMP-binding protein [Pseudonocardiaceae bacterium]|nr:AMP-binding protein [Pseudonocardiaceae bacterium]